MCSGRTGTRVSASRWRPGSPRPRRGSRQRRRFTDAAQAVGGVRIGQLEDVDLHRRRVEDGRDQIVGGTTGCGPGHRRAGSPPSPRARGPASSRPGSDRQRPAVDRLSDVLCGRRAPPPVPARARCRRRRRPGARRSCIARARCPARLEIERLGLPVPINAGLVDRLVPSTSTIDPRTPSASDTNHPAPQHEIGLGPAVSCPAAGQQLLAYAPLASCTAPPVM